MTQSPLIRFGVHTFIWKKEFLGHEEFIFDRAKSWGFDSVEIATHSFEQINPDTIKSYQDKYGLGISFCTSMPQGLSLTSADRQCWEESVNYVQKAIEFCQNCGITQLSGPLIHPVGYLSGKPLQDEEEKLLHQALREIADTVSNTEIKIAIEPLNRFQGYALNTVEQGLRLLNSIDCPHLGLLLDLFHMNIEEKDMIKAFLQAGKKCFHVHVSAKDRGTPGSDTLPWIELFNTLKTIEYQGLIVIESFNAEDTELATAAKIWRKVAPSSQYIAQEGLKFLHHTYQTSLS
ncbi:sugar phosphate isomerase/epimerase [Geminocystis sp. NIES-3709]|uniref:sugar phosphate isomerase/epimerase family protein n=1 Tax=Geminocystis sp. NIES-3709 TaxID=1617448 RepID=UPI0005FCDB44|nr:sugar phosphate isomerase/epimerase family protein [Geminocystis sp. NIES-3709]BAQ66054.1 D-tagatose 3-epimerase [Geminocystis sp. NIES-3709]